MSFYGGLSAEHLRQFIERVERLEEEKANIAEDIREVMAEAKGSGFDVKTMRQILKLRKMEAHDLEEQEHLLDTYKRALGMVPDWDDEATSTPSAPSTNANEKNAQQASVESEEDPEQAEAGNDEQTQNQEQSNSESDEAAA